MTNCKLCQQEIIGGMVGCSKGCLCRKCSKDISLAKQQPIMSSDAVLWWVAETFFRKGKGEDVTFEQVWKENENLQLIDFEYLFKLIVKSKTQGGQK